MFGFFKKRNMEREFKQKLEKRVGSMDRLCNVSAFSRLYKYPYKTEDVQSVRRAEDVIGECMIELNELDKRVEFLELYTQWVQKRRNKLVRLENEA